MSGCVADTGGSAHLQHARPSIAEWNSVQHPRVHAMLQGTNYQLSQIEEGLLIRIGEKGTFNPQRPELLMPAALNSIGQITRHLAAEEDVGVMVVGVATGIYKLKSKEQVSAERAQSVASIFQLNRVPGHRLKTLGVSQGADSQLGVALLIVPGYELQRHVAAGHGQVVAMLGRP